MNFGWTRATHAMASLTKDRSKAYHASFCRGPKIYATHSNNSTSFEERFARHRFRGATPFLVAVDGCCRRVQVWKLCRGWRKSPRIIRGIVANTTFAYFIFHLINAHGGEKETNLDVKKEKKGWNIRRMARVCKRKFLIFIFLWPYTRRGEGSRRDLFPRVSLCKIVEKRGGHRRSKLWMIHQDMGTTDHGWYIEAKARLYSLLPFAIGKCHTSSLIASRKLRRVAREGNRDGKAWRKPNQ